MEQAMEIDGIPDGTGLITSGSMLLEYHLNITE
jgi:hypothetical protein